MMMIQRAIDLKTIMSGSRGRISKELTVCMKTLARCLPGRSDGNHEKPLQVVTLPKFLYVVYMWVGIRVCVSNTCLQVGLRVYWLIYIIYICPYVRYACYGMKCVDTLKNVLHYYVTAVSETPYSVMLTLRCACRCSVRSFLSIGVCAVFLVRDLKFPIPYSLTVFPAFCNY